MVLWALAVCKANAAHKVLLVLQVIWVLREQMENKVRKENQDLKASAESKAHKVNQDLKANKAFAERWDHKVFRVCRVYQDRKDSEAKQDRLAPKASKASAESVDCKAYKASMDFKVSWAPKVSADEMVKKE